MKLNNVLVSREGVLKVCDFGFAVQTEDAELTLRYYPNMPVGGNPSHLAPEVLLAATGKTTVTFHTSLQEHNACIRTSPPSVIQGLVNVWIWTYNQMRDEFPSSLGR